MRSKPSFLFLPALAFVLVLLCPMLGAAQAEPKKPLTNADIVKMVSAGFSEATILEAIRSNETAFDTSTDGLLALKQAGVSETVINAMLAAGRRTEKETPPEKPAEPKPAVDPKTPSLVYIYRYKQFVGGGLEPSVYCDETQLARMDNGRYLAVRVAPGKHIFRSNDKQSGVEIELKPGETYYLRVEIATGFFKGHGRLVVSPAEQGAFEIKKLLYIGADKIKHETVLREDPQPATAK